MSASLVYFIWRIRQILIDLRPKWCLGLGMKITLCTLFASLMMFGCGGEVVDALNLQHRNGLEYLRNEESPFSGRAESFLENGQKSWEKNYKDGKLHGLLIYYNKDGTEDRRETYKDGQRIY